LDNVDFLLEIGTEELPASYIAPALAQLVGMFRARMKEARLEVGPIATGGTPRRLALGASGVSARQKDAVEEVTGPPAKVAFDEEGKPTRAAIGFAKSQGVELADLHVKTTPKGEYCVVEKRVEGRGAVELLSEVLPEMIRRVRFPKSMRWEPSGLSFARPIRWLVALCGEKVVPVDLGGVRSGRRSCGHAFLAPERFEIASPSFEAYAAALRKRYVLVNRDERREQMRKRIDAIMARHGPRCADEALLEEVTEMVEFPGAVEGTFDPDYLSVPAEVIVEAMKEHQKYFPIYDANGNLLPRFVATTNRSESYSAEARIGNERVLEARLADAKFFWEADKRTPLESKRPALAGLAFHERLGSYLDRTARLERLAEEIARGLGYSDEETAMARRAAHLCKADLVTLMVGEFPKLQGIMGREYARVDGEPESVAVAIAEHYLPRYADDVLPRQKAGIALGLADKFDAIAGCFAVGLIPTGSQDPYALRRLALGVIRIVKEHRLNFSLAQALQCALQGLPSGLPAREDVLGQVMSFFRDRLYQICTDSGSRYDIVNAVLAAGFDDPCDFFDRVEVLTELSAATEWPALVTVVERTFNIGKKVAVRGPVEPDLFVEGAERKLWETLRANESAIRDMIERRQYRQASIRYHDVFAEPVHTFYEQVFVNVDDARVRDNRLRLLKEINEMYSTRVADLSQIVTDEGTPGQGNGGT